MSSPPPQYVVIALVWQHCYVLEIRWHSQYVSPSPHVSPHLFLATRTHCFDFVPHFDFAKIPHDHQTMAQLTLMDLPAEVRVRIWYYITRTLQPFKHCQRLHCTDARKDMATTRRPSPILLPQPKQSIALVSHTFYQEMHDVSSRLNIEVCSMECCEALFKIHPTLEPKKAIGKLILSKEVRPSFRDAKGRRGKLWENYVELQRAVCERRFKWAREVEFMGVKKGRMIVWHVWGA